MKKFFLNLIFYLGEIFAFNVPVSETVREHAKLNNVVIHEDNVIYKLFDNLVDSLSKRLPLREEQEIMGKYLQLKGMKLLIHSPIILLSILNSSISSSHS